MSHKKLRRGLQLKTQRQTIFQTSQLPHQRTMLSLDKTYVNDIAKNYQAIVKAPPWTARQIYSQTERRLDSFLNPPQSTQSTASRLSAAGQVNKQHTDITWLTDKSQGELKSRTSCGITRISRSSFIKSNKLKEEVS